MEELKLTRSEKDSALWKKIEQYLQHKIDVCRRKNDGDLTEGETAKLRGRILAHKELLVLGESQPPVEADSTTD